MGLHGTISYSSYLCKLAGGWWAWPCLCKSPPCSSGSGGLRCCGGSSCRPLRSSSPTACTAPCWIGSGGRGGCSCTLRREKERCAYLPTNSMSVTWLVCFSSVCKFRLVSHISNQSWCRLSSEAAAVYNLHCGCLLGCCFLRSSIKSDILQGSFSPFHN